MNSRIFFGNFFCCRFNLLSIDNTCLFQIYSLHSIRFAVIFLKAESTTKTTLGNVILIDIKKSCEPKIQTKLIHAILYGSSMNWSFSTLIEPFRWIGDSNHSNIDGILMWVIYFYTFDARYRSQWSDTQSEVNEKGFLHLLRLFHCREEQAGKREEEENEEKANEIDLCVFIQTITCHIFQQSTHWYLT